MTSCEDNKHMCKSYEEFVNSDGRSLYDGINATYISNFLVQFHTNRYLQLSQKQFQEKFELIVRKVYRTTERTPSQKRYASTIWPQYDKVDSLFKTAEIYDDIRAYSFDPERKTQNANHFMCSAFKGWVEEDEVTEPNAKYISEFLNSWYADNYLLLSEEEHNTQFDLLLRRTWNVMELSTKQTWDLTAWLELINKKQAHESSGLQDLPDDWFGFPSQSKNSSDPELSP